LGLLLQNMHLPLEQNERVGVFLTNALTGWESPHGHQQMLGLPELEQERDAAEHVKQDLPILVVLGNPPYNGFAGMATAEERGLTDAYRTTKKAPAPQGQGLNDLYVRFFRMAERRIVEKTGKGIVCFISNYSWLDGLSFTGMRERYLEVFDKIWIDCLNGDKYKTGKLTPDGKPDPSIFSTEHNREGIQVGTAIARLCAQSEKRNGDLFYRSYWGSEKLERLSREAISLETPYSRIQGKSELGLPFAPGEADNEYLSWTRLSDLLPFYTSGVTTSRDDLLVDVDREALVKRMLRYFDPAVSEVELAVTAPSSVRSKPGFDARSTRQRLLSRGFLPENVRRYQYRPLDLRWVYWEPETKLVERKRAEYVSQVAESNRFLFTTGRTRKSTIEPPLMCSGLADLNLMDSIARCFPVRVKAAQPELGSEIGDFAPNLDPRVKAHYVLEASEGDAVAYHSYSMMSAPHYRSSNQAGLRLDWPRIPLPDSKELLLASAELGRKVADLLDPETEVHGVTGGSVRPELKVIGVPTRIDGRPLNEKAGDLAVTAGWGHAGQGGVTMPGKGKINTRPWTEEERAAIGQGSEALGLSAEQALAQLGEQAVDVYLNDVAYWRGVPSGVWSYTIGGYQVMKKWLSYREKPLLGRDLKVDEVREVQMMARRIAAILLLPRLDANYAAVKGHTHEWGRREGTSGG
jgi:predicted helicase